MGSQYTTVTYEGQDFWEVQLPDKVGPVEYKRSYQCVLCGFDFKKDQVKLKGGAAFCVPNECYLEMDEPRTGGDI